MNDFYQVHATVCRTIAHAKRLQILDLLRSGERSVNDLAEAMGASAANVSQQLAVLRGAGVVRTRREGTTVYYSVANPKILQAYDLMTQVMRDQIASLGAQASRPPVAAPPRRASKKK